MACEVSKGSSRITTILYLVFVRFFDIKFLFIFPFCVRELLCMDYRRGREAMLQGQIITINYFEFFNIGKVPTSLLLTAFVYYFRPNSKVVNWETSLSQRLPALLGASQIWRRPGRLPILLLQLPQSPTILASFHHTPRLVPSYLLCLSLQQWQRIPALPETKLIGRSLGHTDQKTRGETETKEQNISPKRQT